MNAQIPGLVLYLAIDKGGAVREARVGVDIYFDNGAMVQSLLKDAIADDEW